MKLLNAIQSSLPAAILGCLALGIVPTSVNAATVTTTFAVTATVQATCLVSATPMTFGTYTGVQLASTTSTVSVTCTNTTPYNVGLNAGVAAGATVTARSMTGPGSALLGYSLFSDSARTVNWGQTIGTDTVTGAGNGAAQAITVYGQVAAAQYVAPGAYTDTITATVTY
jgi:spore coat protein U-like protein